MFGFGILFGFIGVRRDFAGGLAEEIEDEKSGSEEEITRKLGFDGEAVGVGKPKERWVQPAQRRVVSRERPQESSRDCIKQKRHTTAVLTKKALIAQILRREGVLAGARGE